VAEIYYSDREMNHLISHKAGVRRAVASTARQGAARAEAILAAHRYQGHSRITVTFGEVDAFVNLDDTRGQRAAAAIEYGTRRSTGIFALRSAF
jgi:hypothetical protein